MPRYLCPNCQSEYQLSNEEHRSNRFCRKCGTRLRPQPQPKTQPLQQQQMQMPDRPVQSQKPYESTSNNISNSMHKMDRYVEPERRHFKARGIVSFLPRAPVAVIEDIEKAKKMASILHDQFSHRTGFFEGYEALDYIGPSVEASSDQLALYLTYVMATIDRQTDVDGLLEQAKVEYQRNPEMFTPQGVIKAYPNLLERFVRGIGSRRPSNGAWAWKKISDILLREYQGTPLNLTKNPETVDTLRQKIERFPHLKRRKLSNFYIRLMFEKGFFKIVDPENIPVVPDVQIGRISFYTGVLKTKDGSSNNNQVGLVGNNPIRSHIEHVWSEATKPLGIPPAYLDEALWLIGSKLCTTRDCSSCPIEALCDKNISISLSGDF